LKIGTVLTSFALGTFLQVGVAYADAPVGEEPEHGQKAPVQGKKGKKKRARGPVFSGRLASVGELREEPLDKPSGHIELYAVNFQEKLVVDLYNEDGSLDDEAVDKLNHLWRCKRTDTEKSIDPRLFEMLSRIYDKFEKPIELVSGFRNQQRTSSFHFHGSASDIRIPGVSEKALHAFVATLDTGGMGIGIYPRAGFVHVDIRPEPSYRWTDYSPPGTSDMGHPHKGKKSKKKSPNA
jgi:uncharacterized protein YcbK (DUF882 family)